MNEPITAPREGSATMQGDLWSARARDYAELQEVQFRPLYESVLHRLIGFRRVVSGGSCASQSGSLATTSGRTSRNPASYTAP